ncbi:MAG TPA: nitroreductase family protein [Acidimicrobiales bacterium]|nr:nitroreductase family protein [Acidimicrobiales bacterium]
MELDEVIRRRRMCRDFSDRPVGRDVVDRLLDRARRAPSAGHTQGWAFLVMEGPAEVGRFWRATSDPDWLAAPSLPGLLRAPVVVVPMASESAYRDRYGEKDKALAGPAGGWSVPYWTVDVSFATMLLLLGAVDERLGALFFGLRPGSPDRLRHEFGVPDGWDPIGAVALGWPAPAERPSGSSTRRPRRAWDEVVHRGGW